MGYLSPGLTNTGLDMMAEAMNGTGFVFTKIVIGNGTGTEDPADATEVANPLMTIGLSSIEQADNYVVLTARFDNTQLVDGFYINELGVFARQDNSQTEQLYAYRYTATEADYIPGNASGRITEVTMKVIVAIGEADNVSAVLIDADVYASKEDLEDHIHDYNNPHRVTKAQVGLGNVPNSTPSNMTITFTRATSLANLVSGKSLSTLFGLVAKAVADLIAHLAASNPHKITAAMIGAATTSHKHSAADITSGTLPITRGGTGVTSLASLKTTVNRKITFANYTITAAGWTDAKTYSLEATYAKTAYHVEVSLAKTATIDQQKAFAKAKLVGDKDNNILTALGKVPTINVPVFLKLVEVI